MAPLPAAWSAAVAAARLGKTVALVSLNNHVGGMTASGLGVTDIGPGNDYSYLGGISREFYRRVGAAYGSTNLVIWFEPHVAEKVFWQMLAEAGVAVYTNQLLASVTMTNQRIAQMTMQDGSVFRAKQFIDTTYEGDLMAAAGVTFTWGREGTNAYNESLAGIRSPGGTLQLRSLRRRRQSRERFAAAGQHEQRRHGRPGRPTAAGLQLPPLPDAERHQQDRHRRAGRLLRVATMNWCGVTSPRAWRQDGSVALTSSIDVQTIIPNGKTDINATGRAFHGLRWLQLHLGHEYLRRSRGVAAAARGLHSRAALLLRHQHQRPRQPECRSRIPGAWPRTSFRTPAAGPGKSTSARRAAWSATT